MGKGYTILGKSCTWEEYCEYEEMLWEAPWGIVEHEIGNVLKTPIGIVRFSAKYTDKRHRCGCSCRCGRTYYYDHYSVEPLPIEASESGIAYFKPEARYKVVPKVREPLIKRVKKFLSFPVELKLYLCRYILDGELDYDDYEQEDSSRPLIWFADWRFREGDPEPYIWLADNDYEVKLTDTRNNMVTKLIYPKPSGAFCDVSEHPSVSVKINKREDWKRAHFIIEWGDEGARSDEKESLFERKKRARNNQINKTGSVVDGRPATYEEEKRIREGENL